MMRNCLFLNSNLRSGIKTEVYNNFTVQFYARPITDVTMKSQSNSGTAGTASNPYLFMPTHRGSEAGFGVVVGKNGIMVVEHGDSYAPCVCVHSCDLSKWSWITITVSNRVSSIWIDGVKVKTGNTSGKSKLHLDTTLGGGTWGGYNGGLAEVAMWNRVLTDEEIIKGVKKGTNHLSEGLLRYYKCNTGAGTVLIDSAKSNNLQIEEALWSKEEIEFEPYKSPDGSGVMYTHKRYDFSNNQILHRGIKLKGKTGNKDVVSLIGSNVLEGTDIGQIANKVNFTNTTLSFGNRKSIDINELVQSTNGNESNVNKNIYNQISRVFPPAEAFKSGSFDNYAFMIKELKWGNANFLTFPTSAVQKVNIKQGERIVTNDDFLIGDIRGYQLVKKNITTEVVYGGLLEVYPKAKVVDIAYVTFLDRPVVFNVFNNMFAPEYEFNNGIEEDDGVTRPPHAEVYDLYELFEQFKFKDKVINVNEKVGIGRLTLKDVVPSFSYNWFDSVHIAQTKVGETILYESGFEDLLEYNQKLVTVKGENMYLTTYFRETFNLKEISEQNGYEIFEVPFDITDFKSIEQINYQTGTS